jgi:hypothetical protein
MEMSGNAALSLEKAWNYPELHHRVTACPTIGSMATSCAGAEPVDVVARELALIRWRGLYRLDKSGYKQVPIEVPEITRLAQRYCQGRSATNRTAQITWLLEDSIRTYTMARDQAVGDILSRLFFEPNLLNPPSKALDAFKQKVGLHRQEHKATFDKLWEEIRKDFAVFLLSFVGRTAGRSAPTENSIAINLGQPQRSNVMAVGHFHNSLSYMSAKETWRTIPPQHEYTPRISATCSPVGNAS